MKYYRYLFFFLLLNCQEKVNYTSIDDITNIIYTSDKITYDITGNFYILDERFKNPGQHNLNISNDDLYSIKNKIIEEEIYKLDDSLKFLKSCNTQGCLSRINIRYKSGRKQYFIFDNSNYKDNFNSKSYKKIITIEEMIGKIIISNIKEPEPVKVYF
ncbi:hypothetical protein [Chryseobacterium lactis]|uniref:hypothetical protein n=1 Tax=Chryseobacterium lactis TaxID=1241981 RepID=UPI001624C3B8|nr:hypothetical protein [Chryseobacterium lactis]